MFKISTHLGREAEHHTTSRLASLVSLAGVNRHYYFLGFYAVL